MRLLKAFSILLAATALQPAAWAEIYETTDAEGNPEFSDSPSGPNAEAIDLQQTNIIDAPPADHRKTQRRKPSLRSRRPRSKTGPSSFTMPTTTRMKSTTMTCAASANSIASTPLPRMKYWTLKPPGKWGTRTHRCRARWATTMRRCRVRLATAMPSAARGRRQRCADAA
ncbi:MAG: DUF4124 domain-containing protein [Haliea sp.]|nr:DUF4124 domain-containing protein [Haliea sp.]